MLAAISANTDAPINTTTDATPKKPVAERWPAAMAGRQRDDGHRDRLAIGVENRSCAERYLDVDDAR